MRLSALVYGLSLVACGGGATPQAAAPDEGTGAEPGPAVEPAASVARVDRAADGDAASGAGEAPSAEVLSVVLQRVIEDEELDRFLHLTSPGRFPLKIAGKELPSGLTLTKAGQPVAVVPEPTSKKEAVLVFTRLEVEAKRATITYRYDVEGIQGTARLEKGEQGWGLTASRIVER